LHDLLEAIEKEADRDHAISLKIDPEVSAFDAIVTGNLRNAGFIRAAKQIQPRATFIINLDRPLDELLAGFEEKTRYNIRLAEKKGVSVQEEPDETGIGRFYSLYQTTAQRDRFMIHPKIYYQKIREIMFAGGLGTNFVAYYQGQPVAAVIIFSFGRKIWYMYGASSSEARNVMPNHLLHWEVIKWAKERGYKQYDLWGIPFEPKKSHPLFGVYRFKKGFHGDLVKYVGAYDFPYSPLLHGLLENGLIWYQNLRRLVTKGKIEDSLSE